MNRDPSCGSPEHTLARRGFLGALAGSSVVGGLGALAGPAAARKLEADQKRVVVVYMSGGLSQLESWDPKPKTDTGGPFRAIPTSVPGVHICELLPLTAQRMHELAIIRSINTKNGDHGKGRYQMTYGRNQMPGMDYPHIGAVAARALEVPTNPLPGHIHIPSSGRGSNAAYLGPKYNSIGLKGDPPANSQRADDLTAEADERRNDFRRRANDRFAGRRRTAETDVYTMNHERALQLMERRDVFDVTKEKDADHERYGKCDLGKHMLLARRLLENGITFVQVSHSNYDTHNENFTFHLEQLAEFDRAFSALVTDLSDRGMFESTLVVVMSEFGRTPRINARYGRDHWGNAWSVCLGGGAVKGGAVIGKTNENGTKVVDREVDHGHLFHTYLQAVGLDPTDSFDIGGRPMPMADPARTSIDELVG